MKRIKTSKLPLSDKILTLLKKQIQPHKQPTMYQPYYQKSTTDTAKKFLSLFRLFLIEEEYYFPE